MVSLDAIQHYGLLGERLCLDFTNTSDEHPSKADAEFLSSYTRLIEWSVFTQAIGAEQAEALLKSADAQPAKAAAALQTAIIVRDTLYRVLSAAAAHRAPNAADMTAFNGLLAAAMRHMRMQPEGSHFSWAYVRDDHDFEAMLWPVIWSASMVLMSGDLRHLRECAAKDCTWLFLDTSKNHSRRWCSMTQCGNRAKARSHYQRVRKNGSDAG